MILKTLFKASMLLVIIVGGLSYVAYLRTGQNVFSLLQGTEQRADLESHIPPAPSLTKMPEAVGNKLNQVMQDIANSGSDPNTKPSKVVYKWQNSQGKWQYSNQKPPAGIVFQEVTALP